MTSLRVFGIDPGPIPGIAVLDIEDARLVTAGVLQCSAGLLWSVLDGLLASSPSSSALIATERFVVRGRANAAQALTRDQVAMIQRDHPFSYARAASQVKPWATDARLEAAGLLELCKGMRHARDAARHALFAAVHDGALPDPLSKEWNR